MDRRLTLACALGALAATAFVAPVMAQSYPESVVTVVVPFAPGGGSDQAARFVTGPLGEALGQSFIVENHPGAGGNLGIAYAAKAEADGYTLLVASSAMVINPSISLQQTYDPLEDFDFISQIGFSPNVLVAHRDGPVQSYEELLAYAQENPGDLFYSSAGVGTPTHLITELFKIEADINIEHIPYQGASPAVVAVVGEEVELGMASLSVALPYIMSGDLVPIVQTGARRSPHIPDTPTLVEAGFPDAISETFQSLYAPAGVPEDILDLLADELVAILETPEMQASLEGIGFERPEFGREALRARVEREYALWAEVIEAAGIERQ